MNRNPSAENSISVCRICIDQCNDCISYCQGKAEMELCAKLCAACVRACERYIIASRDGFVHHPEQIEEYINACDRCATECEKYNNEVCRNCSQACRKCEEACRSLTLVYEY